MSAEKEKKKYKKKEKLDLFNLEDFETAIKNILPKKTKQEEIQLWSFALYTKNKELKDFLESNTEKENNQAIEIHFKEIKNEN